MNEEFISYRQRSQTPTQSDDVPAMRLPQTSPLRQPSPGQLSSSPLRRSPGPFSDLPSSQLSSSSQAALPRATVKQKIMVLDWYHFHSATQQQTVAHFRYNPDFGITKSSFNRWVKDEHKLRSSMKLLSVEERRLSKKIQSQEFKGADKCLEKWVEQQLFEDETFSEKTMIQKWVKFERLYNPSSPEIKDLDKVKSNGWIHSFKTRMKSRRELIHTFVEEQLSHYSDTPEKENKRLQIALQGVKDQDIFHIDEFLVTDRIVPIGSQYSRFTIGLCVNADGSEVLDSLIISHLSELEGTTFSRVGLTPEVFWEYLTRINDKLGERKIVLLLDRLYAHVTATGLSNIKIVWIEKLNSPLELTIRWFKLELKILLIKHMLVEWTNHRRVKVRTELEILLLIRQVIDQLPSQFAIVQNSWASAGIRSEATPNWVNFRDQENTFGTLLRAAQDKKLIHTYSLSFKELLFPADEFIANKHLSDEDIVAFVKFYEKDSDFIRADELETKKQKKNNEMNIERHFDIQQLKNVDNMIHHEMTRFFEDETTIARLPRSSTAFLKFLNEYVSESMNAWVEEQ